MDRKSSVEQAEQFLAQSGQFRLGELVTEQPHPATAGLSQAAKASVIDALQMLFEVDLDVVWTYREWIEGDAPGRIAKDVLDALTAGGRIYFTGCGATGRLSILLEAIWREFWEPSAANSPKAGQLKQIPDTGCQMPDTRTPIRNPQSAIRSVMAGGDYALIKSVEGFEDYAQFGAKQIEDAGVSQGDIVFAITEGGETPFVIGTAQRGAEKGAKVYFVYCNPDSVLRENITRSREILDDPRIERINLTTGPMAITGSTRMQAASIQLCAMLTILEMVIRSLLGRRDSASVPQELLEALDELQMSLGSESVCRDLAGLVYLEETVYRLGRKSTYFADRLAVDVLTDTTERSPTFCIPAFRKWDDSAASESWAFLILPHPDSKQAWEHMLKRPPDGLAWTADDILGLVTPTQAGRQIEIMEQIGPEEILKFRIGLDGLQNRPIRAGDAVVCVISESEKASLTSPDGFHRRQIEAADASGAFPVLVFLGRPAALQEIREFLFMWDLPCSAVLLPVPESNFLLDGLARVGAKMLLNALSTCVMVRLGRVYGNCMTAVVPSNLKLIDRSARYIRNSTGLSYEDACRLLFEAIEYVRPRMEAGQDYPPLVVLSVIRATDKCSFEEAESRWRKEQPA